MFDLEFIDNTSKKLYIQYGVIHGAIRSCDGGRFPSIYGRLTEKFNWEFVQSLGKNHGVSVYNATKKGNKLIACIKRSNVCTLELVKTVNNLSYSKLYS